MDATSLYKQFIVKDLAGYALPGMILLTGLAFHAPVWAVTPLVTDAALTKSLVPILGVSYLLGHVLHESTLLLEAVTCNKLCDVWDRLGNCYVSTKKLRNIVIDCGALPREYVESYVHRLDDMALLQSNAGLALMIFSALSFLPNPQYDEPRLIAGPMAQLFAVASTPFASVTAAVVGLLLFLGSCGTDTISQYYTKALRKRVR